jgi:hypothetical protein
MKRRVSLMAIMVGSFLLSAALAQAEVRFNVPFDFTVGDVSLPAGSYSVGRVGSAQTHLQLRSYNLSEGAIGQFHFVQLNPGEVSEASKLVFHRYGNQYFLAQFWTLGSTTGYELRRSKAEREIGRNVAQPKTEILPAGQ